MHAEGYPNLKPSPGRPSKLNDPSFLKVVCELFANGLSREAMVAELQDLGFDVRDVDTISRWRRDARVKVLTSKLIEDRAIQVSRKVDAILAGRLAHADNMSTKDLIMIRKEYGGSTVGRREIAGDEVTIDAMKAIEENPNLADELEALFAAKPEENYPSVTEDVTS